MCDDNTMYWVYRGSRKQACNDHENEWAKLDSRNMAVYSWGTQERGSPDIQIDVHYMDMISKVSRGWQMVFTKRLDLAVSVCWISWTEEVVWEDE